MTVYQFRLGNTRSLSAFRSYLLAFFFIISMRLATGATITGTVSDSSTGALLSGVTVQPGGTFDQFVTDDQGRFTLTVTSTAVNNSRSISAKADFLLTGRSFSMALQPIEYKRIVNFVLA
jgi:hypothetical protein